MKSAVRQAAPLPAPAAPARTLAREAAPLERTAAAEAAPRRSAAPGDAMRATHPAAGTRFALGHALQQVRVRAVAEDAPRARGLGALAYTVAGTVHVPPGLDRPRTAAGREVLAHEFVHAQQWRNAAATGSKPWPARMLEAEAHALAPRMARGEAVTVRGVHRDPAPLLHPIFISTHGRQGYLNLARQFYVRWGYGTPVSIGSIEEMVEHLAGDRGRLDRVTLVSHAVPSNINVAFLRGGPGFVLESDWAVDTLEELPQLAQHVTDDAFRDEVLGALRRDGPAQRMLAAIGLGRANDDPIAVEYVWWLLDAWYVGSQRARGRSARRQRDAVAAAADAHAQVYRAAMAVAMGAAGGAGGFTFPGFETQFARVMQSYVPGGIGMGTARRLVNAAGNRQVDRILGAAASGTPTFFDRLETVRQRLTPATCVEVQGCRVGRQPSYLSAMSGFFGGALVTAPDWFQIFGHVGFRQEPADDDRTMRRLWRDRLVRRALAHWAPILTGNPLPDEPGWEDLAAFLRAGHPLILGRRLLLTRPMSEQALIEFLARQRYRITAEDELREEFLEGRTLRQATTFAIVDWLQENRNGSGGIAFRPDPEYANHIKRSR